MDQQKRREWIWMNRFRARSGLAFEIDDDRIEKERPDFLVRLGGQLVGVEICELQIDYSGRSRGGSQLQQEHSLRQQVVRSAQQTYCEKAAIPINVGVVFRPKVSLVSLNRSELAARLVSVLRQVSILPGQQSILDLDSTPAAPDPITFVQVDGLHNDIEASWDVCNAGWSKQFEASDVQALVDKKNQQMGTFRVEGVSQVWLLIVVDRMSPAGRFQIPEIDRDTLPRSAFDRTFLLCEPGTLITWP